MQREYYNVISDLTITYALVIFFSASFVIQKDEKDVYFKIQIIYFQAQCAFSWAVSWSFTKDTRDKKDMKQIHWFIYFKGILTCQGLFNVYVFEQVIGSSVNFYSYICRNMSRGFYSQFYDIKYSYLKLIIML